jgi:Protein of unknown function (DUF2934)
MSTQLPQSNLKPTHDEIARRAQAIYEESGRIPGRDEQNWLQAESQLIATGKRQAEAQGGAASKPAGKPAQRQNGGQEPGNRQPGQSASLSHRV